MTQPAFTQARTLKRGDVDPKEIERLTEYGKWELDRAAMKITDETGKPWYVGISPSKLRHKAHTALRFNAPDVAKQRFAEFIEELCRREFASYKAAERTRNRLNDPVQAYTAAEAARVESERLEQVA